VGVLRGAVDEVDEVLFAPAGLDQAAGAESGGEPVHRHVLVDPDIEAGASGR
jgi:hypothetical protein